MFIIEEKMKTNIIHNVCSGTYCNEKCMFAKICEKHCDKDGVLMKTAIPEIVRKYKIEITKYKTIG